MNRPFSLFRRSCALVLIRPIVIALAMAPMACSHADQAVRGDVDRYLRRINDWAPVEAETARAIDRILKTQFVDDAEVRRQIADDRPRVVAHMEVAAAVKPTTAAVRAVHQRYLAAWRELLAGYDAILRGLDSADAGELSRGRAALSMWRAGIRRTAQDLRDLRPDE